MPVSPALPIAALVTRSSCEADQLIADFSRQQIAAGRRIRGLRQTLEACDNSGCMVVLIDLENEQRYPITQDLGPGSAACGLDPGLMADAAQVMRRIADEGADLAIFNRFGALEAEGGGLAAEMLDLMSRGQPVLVIVGERHLPAWRSFTGGLACELPASAEAVNRWFQAVIG